MENSLMTLKYHVSPTDFTRAGEASSDVKNTLKKLGVPSTIVRKVAIAMYEGEINMVIHAQGGDITVDITPDQIHMVLKDVGPGIADIEKAKEPLFTTKETEDRAGLGFTIMEVFMDSLKVTSTLGKETKVEMIKKYHES